MSSLFIVATPIGNLQDITIRAIETLFSVDYILSERPEKTRHLLDHLKTRYPELVEGTKHIKIISFNEFDEIQKIPEVFSYLQDESDVALVSEAGTPLLSDPGFKLVRELKKKGVQVIPVPGVSSVTAALSVSALPTDKFLFLGFLPKTKGKKENQLTKLKESLENLDKNNFPPTVIIFESPHRLTETLESLQKVFGDIEIVLAKELTKMYESVEKEKISVFLKFFEEKSVKGEFVILFNLRV